MGIALEVSTFICCLHQIDHPLNCILLILLCLLLLELSEGPLEGLGIQTRCTVINIYHVKRIFIIKLRRAFALARSIGRQSPAHFCEFGPLAASQLDIVHLEQAEEGVFCDDALTS